MKRTILLVVFMLTAGMAAAQSGGSALVALPGPVGLWGDFSFTVGISPTPIFPDYARIVIGFGTSYRIPLLPLTMHSDCHIQTTGRRAQITTREMAVFLWFDNNDEYNLFHEFTSRKMSLDTMYGWVFGNQFRYILTLEPR